MVRKLPTVLVTGASSGIGATYADRFARRGHDLVLVARDRPRMEELASRLRAENRVKIDVEGADLTVSADLARIEARLRADDSIGILVNNAGVAAPGGFANADLDVMDRLIRLNVTAVTRLAGAVIPRFLDRGEGAIINIASVRRPRAGDFVRRLWSEQGLCSGAIAKPASRTRRSRRLYPGRAARGDPNGDLGEIRPRREHDQGRDGGRRTGRCRARWLRSARGGNHSTAAGRRPVGDVQRRATGHVAELRQRACGGALWRP